ncbi:MAG: acetoacetate--CoA ligase [Nitrososphaerales archaeon]|nr:acetoacetate--CoA ligase [Nitrososphaerales archaeon]
MSEGKLLWEPDQKRVEQANITAYADWLTERGRKFGSYADLWRWSVDDIEGFWGSIWDYFGVRSPSGRKKTLSLREMPGAQWFPGAKVNYTSHVFRESRTGPALIARTEAGEMKSFSWSEFERMVGALATTLKELGVKKGDRVAAYLPNGVEAAVGFLASASIGSIWSSCSPEFGAPSVVDRFGQIGPKALIAVDGYNYGGKYQDRSETLTSILSSLRTVKKVIVARKGQGERLRGELDWEDTTSGREKLRPEPVGSSHPLWILYSSGTTGLPKPIVHGHAGILLEHLKQLSLHNDVKPRDRFFWYTTTGWMMWNYVMGSLLHGATAVLYDGSASHPDMNALWDLVEDADVNFMGVSAAYISACMKASLEPGKTHDLKRLTGMGSTGSTLTPEAFEWVYGNVKGDVWLASISGGTDVCTPFVAGCPVLPVHSGEIQCRCLGAKVESFDESGRSVIGEVGELVVTQPMPSMPLYLWGDKDGRRYRESYFEKYPGIWRHGDWIKVTERGTCVIYGRSDATIKRLGVRIGTSEIYRVVESLPEVAESLAVDIPAAGGETTMLLFVATAGGRKLDDSLVSAIREKISRDLSRRHVPDRVLQAPSVPKTLNGKKLEVPVKRILEGEDAAKALNLDSLANPESISFYVELGARIRKGEKL